MNLYETAWWYLGNILEYGEQMLPCMLMGVVGFLLLRPFRHKRLQGKGLVSFVPRELALLIFVMFCAGLISLTLFPANLWAYVTDWLILYAIGAAGEEEPMSERLEQVISLMYEGM